VTLIAALFCIATWRDVGASCTLKIGWESYVPYQFADRDGRPTGADLELIREVAKAIGCDPVFKQMPWARQLSELRNGTLDVAASASHTPEREEYVRFSVPYRRAEMAIFVLDGTASQYALSSLSDIPAIDFKLGIIFGYYYGEEFEAFRNDPAFATHVDAAADYPTNIRKLLHGRIDGFLVDDVAVMLAEARALGVEDRVERHPLHITGDVFHLMFSRQSVDPEIVAAVDRELERLKAEGRIQAILDKFLD
jgi:polar amino acid transport system substrate-binding protein